MSRKEPTASGTEHTSRRWARETPLSPDTEMAAPSIPMEAFEAMMTRVLQASKRDDDDRERARRDEVEAKEITRKKAEEAREQERRKEEEA